MINLEDLQNKIEELEKRVLKLEITKPNPGRDKHMIHKVKTNTKDKDFDLFWKSYPHRYGKKLNKVTTKRIFSNLVNKEDIPKIMEALDNYASSVHWESGFSQNPSKWLSEENWREYLT